MPVIPLPAFSMVLLPGAGRGRRRALAAALLIALLGCGRAHEDAPARQLSGQRSAVPDNTAAQEPVSREPVSREPVSREPVSREVVAQETWDAVFISGSHVGSVHTTTFDRQDTPRTVRIVSDAQLTIVRYGDKAAMRIVTESVETPEGAVRSFSYRTEAGASPMVVEGSVQPDHAVVTQRTAGKVTTAKLPWAADQGGFFAMEESLRRTPMQAGEQRTLTLLMPGLTGVQLASATLVAQPRETTKLLDGSQDLLPIQQTLHTEGLSLKGFCWTDSQGEIIKSTLMDLQHETYRTTRERALAEPSGEGFDLGFDTIVRVTTPLPQPHSTKQVVYEATLREGSPAELFAAASGAAQRVEAVDNRRARITVRAIRPGDPAEVAPEAAPTEADCQPNSLIQSDDERVRQIADAVAQQVTDPWETCVALEKWVHVGIQKKNFSQGFATAADVAQSLEGDCTEHAVLLAALCRARQIPARVCVGLVYMPSRQGFAFHMWNEVWIADRWVPLDATLGRGGIGAGHIKLRHSNLSSEQAEAAVLSVLQVMNQLQLQIVEAK